MSTIIITGGAGFIGHHLVRALAPSHTLVVVDDLSSGHAARLPAGVELIKADCGTPSLWPELLTKAEAVIHLAAIASVPVCEREWLRAHKTNIGATVALMEAVGHAQRAHQKKIPFIYASSAAVYGVNNDGRLSEDRMVKPFSAYGADKYACELHAAVGARNHNITSVGLRFFNVFGAGQDPSSPYSGVISIFMARLKQQQPLTIFGDGTAARDYIPVEKIVEGIMASLALARAQPEAQSHVFNLCTGQATTAKELADMLSTISGQNSAIDFAPPRAGDVPRSVGDPSAMASVLGVNPAIDLRAALSALWKTV